MSTIDPQLQRLLSECLQNNLYEILAGQAVVKEQEKEGEAHVDCALPPETVGIQWHIENPKLFPFFKQQLAADGSLMVQRPDGTWEAHILECKATVNQDAWAKALRQMRWSLMRLRALAGVLGVQFSRVVLYTAFRKDEMRKDPVLLKLPLGDWQPANDEQAEAEDALQRQREWPRDDTGRVRLDGFEELFSHRKVRLDVQAGTGQVELG
jgi:trans-aconitate methyltransferase